MLAAIEVKLVEDPRSFLDLVQQLGPLFVAGAAIVAALVAWRSAGTRLDKRLSHDREALERQLAHDRQLRRDEYRLNALDSALELVSELAKAMQEALRTHRFAETIWTAAEKTLADPALDEAEKERVRSAERQATQDFASKVDVVAKRLPEFSAAIARLKVRFGRFHEIPTLAEASHKAWEVQRVNLNAAVWSGKALSEEAAADWKADSKTAIAAYADLMVACEEWLASGQVNPHKRLDSDQPITVRTAA